MTSMTTFEDDLATAMRNSLVLEDNRPLQVRRRQQTQAEIQDIVDGLNNRQQTQAEIDQEAWETSSSSSSGSIADIRAADQAQNARGQVQESVRITEGRWTEPITLAEAKVETLQAEHAIFTFEEWRQYGFKHGMMKQLFDWAQENAPAMEEAKTRPPPPPPPVLNLSETGVLFDIANQPKLREAGMIPPWGRQSAIVCLLRSLTKRRFGEWQVSGAEVRAILKENKVVGTDRIMLGLRERVKINGEFCKTSVEEQRQGRIAVVKVLQMVGGLYVSAG